MKNLHCKSFTILITLLTVAFTPSCFTQQPAEGNTEIVKSVALDNIGGRFETDILFHINNYRKSKGLAALNSNDIISEQAKFHSVNMASRKVAFSHDGFENRMKMISRKIGTLRSSAENVAYGKLTAKEVVDIWLRSAGHRKNIEGKFQLTGIGLAKSIDGVIYFTQIFTTK